MYTQGRVFACREGEQSLAAATATPRIALVLTFAVEGNLRLVAAFGLLEEVEGDLSG